MLKIAFYGKSGVGKSTIALETIEYFQNQDMEVEVVKLAYPLYVIQKLFYDIAHVKMNFYDQNQKLLENIATFLREINPECIVENFQERYKQSKAEVIINDDIREIEVDYPFLKKEGFIFVKVQCNEKLRIDRLKKRNDLNSILNSKTTQHIEKIVPDFIVDTSHKDINITKNKLYKYLEQIRSGKDDINR